ncbi:flagellar biosynthesis anti-sigma factor FlgM [Pseudohongiella acticola]|jgi:negative regulator of flagellin synthesis FlgM|uniref:Negative regulator of flagellin synthesis n=1 Tax=Pseudohongiella acticola TaxID=1524254 RepID=A0A1E8CGH0_9GAMM|nr:flagellar biosynthesis anti-sigma factor FlgM [Pseudohongiella acticola]OFE11564.1 flagellar biosynthesis anti-sigma factor FlgM [Pseudohongiella acticola]
MSIPTISNTSTATDNRGTVRQTGTQPGSGNGVGNSNVGSQGEAGNSQPDAVSISSRAADLQSLETSIKQLPDTDVSRVNAIRDQVNAGEYAVNSQRVADKMLAFERSL